MTTLRARRAVLSVLVLLGAVASVTAPAASAGSAAPTQVAHRRVLAAGWSSPREGTSTGGSPFGPVLSLPRRAKVEFTVSSRTPDVGFFQTLPRAAGRYLAFYFPGENWGWALLPDPGSSRGWSAELDFGQGFSDLLPGHRYTVLVAMDRPTRVAMPFPMHVVSVHAASFRAAALSDPLSMSAPSVATIGSTPDTLGAMPITSTAIALDWKNDLSPVSDLSGDACPAASQTDAFDCGQGDLSYWNDKREFGGPSSPAQQVVGEGFDAPVEGAQVAAYAANAPTPFDAATILGFALDPRG